MLAVVKTGFLCFVKRAYPHLSLGGTLFLFYTYIIEIATKLQMFYTFFISSLSTTLLFCNLDGG